MIGIYDASRTTQKLPLLAGNNVLDKYGINIDPNFGSKYCYLLTGFNGQIVYIVRFQCNLEDEQGRRKNTRLAVHVGKPESAEQLKEEVKTTLENEYRINGEIIGFLADYHDSGAGHLRNIVKKIEASLGKNGHAELEVGSSRTAGGLAGILHGHEVQAGNLYPVAVAYHSDGLDNFAKLENLTGGSGVHIVINEYGSEGVEFRKETGLIGKVKGLF